MEPNRALLRARLRDLGRLRAVALVRGRSTAPGRAPARGGWPSSGGGNGSGTVAGSGASSGHLAGHDLGRLHLKLRLADPLLRVDRHLRHLGLLRCELVVDFLHLLLQLLRRDRVLRVHGLAQLTCPLAALLRESARVAPQPRELDPGASVCRDDLLRHLGPGPHRGESTRRGPFLTGLCRSAEMKPVTRNSDTPSTIRPHGHCPVANSAIAPIMPATASTSRSADGGTPKYRRSETCGSTGVGPPRPEGSPGRPCPRRRPPSRTRGRTCSSRAISLRRPGS